MSDKADDPTRDLRDQVWIGFGEGCQRLLWNGVEFEKVEGKWRCVERNPDDYIYVNGGYYDKAEFLALCERAGLTGKTAAEWADTLDKMASVLANLHHVEHTFEEPKG